VKRLFLISVLLLQEDRHNFWIRIRGLGHPGGPSEVTAEYVPLTDALVEAIAAELSPKEIKA